MIKRMIKKVVFLALVALLPVLDIFAQDMSIVQYEDSIQGTFTRLVQAKSDEERLLLNSSIDKMFGEVLKLADSFNYPFEKLSNVSKLRSDDDQVRLINWNLNMGDGSFTYFAYVQVSDKKGLMLFNLQDKSINIEDPENLELTDRNWFGALYYKILTNQAGKNTYYTLLGWDGHNDFTNRKLIETFYISGKKIMFGPGIFKMEKSVKNRLVFEYAEQAKMMLRYDEQLKMIVFDHLAPSQKKLEGQFMFYGPDMSHDGLIFKDGFWEFRANLDLRNLEDPKVKNLEKSF
jgi:hypothetical protein